MSFFRKIYEGYLAAIGASLLALTGLLLLGGWHLFLRALDKYLRWSSQGLTTTKGTMTIAIALSLAALLGLWLYHLVSYRRVLRRVADNQLSEDDKKRVKNFTMEDMWDKLDRVRRGPD
jgi:hypothetical protein